MNSQLQLLYKTTFLKYKKYYRRYTKNVRNGRFESFSIKRQTQILDKIERLVRRLKQLKLQLKLGIAAGSVALALAATSPVQAQQPGPFVENSKVNPLSKRPPAPNGSIPVAADWDGDGDYDFIIGSTYGTISYLENIGSNSEMKLVGEEERATPTNRIINPFSSILVGQNAAPALMDWDRDGDLDLFVGNYTNNIQYYRNDEGELVKDTGNNPFSGIDMGGSNTHPIFIDFDHDGDLDAFVTVNSEQGSVLYFENSFEVEGENKFTQKTSPAGDIAGYDLRPAMTDVDADGDYDLFLGLSDGSTSFYKNDAGTFKQQTGPWDAANGTGNPMHTITVYQRAAPSFIDLDADGNDDIGVIGVYNFSSSSQPEAITYVANTGSFILEKRTGLDNPFEGVDAHAWPDIEFVDWDKDGDKDIFITSTNYSSYYGPQLTYYENTGGQKLIKKPHPLQEHLFFARLRPAFEDVDGDGHRDFIAEYGEVGGFRFVQNNGDDTFSIHDNSPQNPLRRDNVGRTYGADLDFMDIDGDGDMDVIMTGYGADRSQIRLFINNAGTYTEATQTDELLGQQLESYMTLQAVDLDHDGDYDMVTGFQEVHPTINQQLVYYENIGSSSEPNFVSAPGPFKDIYGHAMDFIDWDEDGDLDVFIAGSYGNINYYENQNEAPAVGIPTSTITYTQGGSTLDLFSDLTLTDDTNDVIIGAEVAIITNFLADEDVLSFTPQGGVTGNFDQTTGILTLEGRADINTYATVLQSVTYENLSSSPTSSDRTVAVSALDFDHTTPVAATLTLTVNVVNEPPVLSSSTLSGTFTTGTNAIVIDPQLTITDRDDTSLTAANIKVNNFTSRDILTFTSQGNISGSYTPSTGILSLTGAANLADYQATLRSVRFATTSQSGSRTVEFTVNDEQNTSQPHTVNLSVINPGTEAPQVNSASFTTISESVLDISLCDIISDTDTEFEGLKISAESNNSSANISIEGCDLTVDYEGTLFAGRDEIILEACDATDCTDNIIIIDVQAEPLEIYQALSPDSGDDVNDYWRIDKLMLPNTIDLYNRWGDPVKTFKNYINQPNTELYDLDPGTYYYRIESPSGIDKGYIVIKK